MCALIELKFGTLIGGLKANTRIKFGMNSINSQGIMSNFKQKTKSNFWQTYRINCFEEQIKIA